MTNRFFAFLAIVFFTALLICSPLLGQEKDFGQKYVKMSDADLWALVMNRKYQEELRTLINEIPLSVMAKHARAAKSQWGIDREFGGMVADVLWTEFDMQKIEMKRLFRRLDWSLSGK